MPRTANKRRHFGHICSRSERGGAYILSDVTNTLEAVVVENST